MPYSIYVYMQCQAGEHNMHLHEFPNTALYADKYRHAQNSRI